MHSNNQQEYWLKEGNKLLEKGSFEKALDCFGEADQLENNNDAKASRGFNELYDNDYRISWGFYQAGWQLFLLEGGNILDSDISDTLYSFNLAMYSAPDEKKKEYLKIYKENVNNYIKEYGGKLEDWGLFLINTDVLEQLLTSDKYGEEVTNKMTIINDYCSDKFKLKKEIDNEEQLIGEIKKTLKELNIISEKLYTIKNDVANENLLLLSNEEIIKGLEVYMNEFYIVE